MKRGLQIFLAVLSLIPFGFGIINFVLGASFHLPSECVTARIDSHIRFQFTWFFGLGLIIWWMIPNIEQHTTLFRIIALTMFVGGIGRLVSIYVVGIPDAPIVAATAIELLFPLLILWQNSIRTSKTN
ncbi:MAG: DUF4345 domain-containing protein [Leptolyngbyaceae cyanobacterium]